MADCSRVICDPAEAMDCDEVYGEGAFQIVIPSRGDPYLREQYMICALKRITDRLNALLALINP